MKIICTVEKPGNHPGIGDVRLVPGEMEVTDEIGKQLIAAKLARPVTGKLGKAKKPGPNKGEDHG